MASSSGNSIGDSLPLCYIVNDVLYLVIDNENIVSLTG